MSANILDRFLTWLRAGYPQGVPQSDYVALFGLLHRSLTEQEVEQLVVELYRGQDGVAKDVPEDKIREAIRTHILQEPSQADVMRVLERLEVSGWPRRDQPRAEA